MVRWGDENICKRKRSMDMKEYCIQFSFHFFHVFYLAICYRNERKCTFQKNVRRLTSENKTLEIHS